MSEDIQGSLLPELTEPSKNTHLVVVEGIGEAPDTMRLALNNAMKAGVDAIYLGEQSSIPVAPPSGKLLIFSQGGKFYVEDSSGNVNEIGAGAVSPGLNNLRLSLSATDPNPKTELTAKTVLYALPFLGNRIALYDGDAAVYLDVPVAADLLVRTKTTTLTGDTVNGSTVISDFSGTWKDVFPGYAISGTNIPGGTTVTSIDMAAHTLTLSAAATGDGNDILLTLQAPASSRWDVFATLVSGAVQLHLLKWTSATARATELALTDGVYHLSGAQAYKYLGTITITSTAGEMEDSSTFRGVSNHYKVPGGLWRLNKAAGIALLGGYMSTAQKQAATISLTSGGGTISGAAGNLMDGSTGTTVYLSDQSLNLYVKIDFGSDVVIEQIDIWNTSTVGDCFDNVWIYGSDTGAFAGEETLIKTSTNGASYPGAWWPQAFTAPVQYRYWRLRLYGVTAGPRGQIHELNFKYGTTLAVMGVPWGCEIELWDGTTSVEAVSSASLTKPGLVEFTAVVTDVDRLTITQTDEVTPWLEFGIDPTSGDVYTIHLE